MAALSLPPSSRILCDDVEAGEGVEIGPDVQIECGRLRLGDGARIGCERDADFRASAGVRIKADELNLGDGARIGRSVALRGGALHFAARVRVKDWNDINVRKQLRIGAGGTINEHCEISGVDVQIGRELWMLPWAKIGGGSAFEVQSLLSAGHFLHLGMRSFINTARAVTLGDEIGLGTQTSLYTHGAYASELRGAPVAFAEIRIGDRTWIPGAIVNPGVIIGQDCVIGVGSVVTRNIPDGAMAAGVPCKVLREHAFPRELTVEERLAKITNFLGDFAAICSDRSQVAFDPARLQVTLDEAITIVYLEHPQPAALAGTRTRGGARQIVLGYEDFGLAAQERETFIDLKGRRIDGLADGLSERLLNQLRRHGTRFYYEAVDGRYQPWQER